MLIVAAKIKTQPGRRDDFIKAAQPVIAATRGEAGCVRYELYASTENANEVMYFEQWTSRAALDAHMQTPHLVAFRELRVKEGLVEGQSDVQIFEVSGS